MTDYEKIILEIKNENRQLKIIINDLVKSNDSLTESNKDLQKRLSYYKNPHSPPSSNSLQWREQKAKARQNRNNEPSKRGGIPGHKGATQIFHSQETKDHTLSECPECHDTNITQIKTKKRIMVGYSATTTICCN